MQHDLIVLLCHDIRVFAAPDVKEAKLSKRVERFGAVSEEMRKEALKKQKLDAVGYLFL